MKRKSDRGKRREQLGTVKQLWDEGRSFEEIENTLLATLPEFDAVSSDSESDE